MKRIFVSYARKNKTFAERLARDLNDAGLDVWIDFRRIVGGQQWRDAIFEGIDQADMAVVCLSPSAVQSEWVRREILMARAQHKFIIPVMLIECFDLMKQFDETEQLLDVQIINFENRYERAFPELLSALPGLKTVAPDDDVDPATIPNPFKGLEAFQQTDADLFFGREELTERLLEKLRQERRFLAVVGASGSGKSSLVRAGLIPALRRGALPDSDEWPLVIFTPGYRPIESLAVRLVPVLGGGRLVPEVVAVLERGSETLHQLTEGALIEAGPEARLVLVVDQFEEVFTRASDDEASRFLALLLNAATVPGGRTLVVLTMRADFFDRLSAYPNLAALFEQQNMVIATEMGSDELRRSIEGPATAVGLVYDEGLPERILEDGRGGSLPLLQYALKELYERRDGRRLTLAAYEQIGGVQRALAQHAESIYEALNAAQQDIMRRILLRLVEVSPSGEATRRKLERDELTFREVSSDAVHEVLEMLSAAETRLLIAGRDIRGEEVEPTVTIEVSHEALIREWDRLAGWIAENEEELRYGGELLKAAGDWERHERDADYLLSGSRLVRAEEWLQEADATETQRAFIQASREAADRAAALERQRAEVEADRRRRLFQARVGLVLAIALMALLGLIFALIQADTERDAAERDARRAEELGTALADSNAQATIAAANLYESRRVQSQFLADLSHEQLELGNQQEALLLALESLQYYDHQNPDDPASVNTTEGRAALFAALQYPVQEVGYMAHQGTVNGAMWNDDGTRLLSWSRGGTVRVWDAASEMLRLRHDDSVRGATWSDDETQILSWSADGTVRVWDAATGEEALLLPHEDNVGGAAWNEAETQLVSWSQDDTVRVWDAATGEEKLRLRHDDGVRGATWSEDETRLLTWAYDDTARVWDAATGEEVLRLAHDDAVDGVVWNDDETQILSWSFDETIRVWDAATGEQLLLARHGAEVDGALWNSDETQILSWSFDETARVWDAATGEEKLLLRHENWVYGALWNSDETQILSWSTDGTVRVWHAVTGGQIILGRHAGAVMGAMWHVDETQLVSWASDGTVRRWDTDLGIQYDLLRHDAGVYGAMWNADESQVLTWTSDGTMRVWDTTTGAEVLALRHADSVQGAAWNADRTRILMWSTDSVVRVWDVDSGAVVRVFRHDNRVNGAAWNADETRILAWTFDGAVHVWDAVSGEQLILLQHQDFVRGAAWNADETQILSWSVDGTVRVWDVESSAPVQLLTHDDNVNGAAWNRDESLILTWSGDGTARVWDADSGEEQLVVRHNNDVMGAAWNADETQVLSWSWDGAVRVWDAVSGEEQLVLEHPHNVDGAQWNADETQLLTWTNRYFPMRVWDAETGEPILILSHDEGILGARWNADETRIFSWSYDGTVREWDTSFAYYLDLAEGRVIRDLTNEQRQEFFLPTYTPSPTLTPSATP